MSYLDANPEDRFSHDEAHNITNSILKTVFWFKKLNVYICFSPFLASVNASGTDKVGIWR